MTNSRFPHNDQRWTVDARRNRSLACSAAAMAVLGIIFAVSLLTGCTGHSSASSGATAGAPAASAPGSESARSDYKFDDSPLEPSQSEYSKYVLG